MAPKEIEDTICQLRCQLVEKQKDIDSMNLILDNVQNQLDNISVGVETYNNTVGF